MKNGALLTILVALTALVGVPASAQTLTGTWTLESQGRRGPQTTTLALVQHGETLSGTVTMSRGRRGGGGGGAGARTIEFEGGTVEGDTFTFSYTLEVNGNSIPFTLSGTFEGDAMEGTIDGGRGGGRPFTGERGG